MLVEVVKTFELSRNGITSERFAAGARVDVPDNLVAGLIAEGFVREWCEPQQAKALGPSEENKALFAAEENKAEAPAGQRKSKPRLPQNADEAGLD